MTRSNRANFLLGLSTLGTEYMFSLCLGAVAFFCDGGEGNEE